jgi:hypothetical protein
MKMIAIVCAIAFTVSPAFAAERGTWLRDHFTGEVLVGAAGWRTTIGVDTNAPGFNTVGGGGELNLGLEVGSGFAIFVSGRVLAGGGYLEGVAGLGVQLRLSDRVRLRAGPAAGQLLVDGLTAVIVGGYLAGSIDLIPFGRGRVAFSIAVRFDVDGLVAGSPRLPDTSMALSAGIGLRY